MLDFMHSTKKKNDVNTEETEKTNTTETNNEEWIWVDGYKGTDENMCCRGYQYELNKQYNAEGEIELCSNGFHSCLNLNDVFKYYPLFVGNRFFKVKVLVRKRDINEFNEDKFIDRLSYSSLCHLNTSKIVAKSIIFVQELTYEDLKIDIKKEYPLITNEEIYNECKRIGYTQYQRNVWIEDMKKYGYSETFSAITFDKYNSLQDTFIKYCWTTN